MTSVTFRNTLSILRAVAPAMSESKIEFVKVYDFNTKTITTIPAAELSPGMIRVRLVGSDEIYWAHASQLDDAKSRYWHPPFSGELKEKIVFIQRALSDVYFKTLEYWEDGFRQDLHAQQEIETWFRAAMLYSSYVESRPLSRDEKQEVFSILGACLNSTRETIFETVTLKFVPRSEAERLADDFFSYG
jgi:hypothetical protein